MAVSSWRFECQKYLKEHFFVVPVMFNYVSDDARYDDSEPNLGEKYNFTYEEKDSLMIKRLIIF